jgi:hypothetical protein
MDFDNKIKPVKNKIKPVKKDFDYYRGKTEPHFFIADLVGEDDPEYENTYAGTGPINEVSGKINVPDTSTQSSDGTYTPTGNERTDENGKIIEELEWITPTGDRHLVWDYKDKQPMAYDFDNVADFFDYTPEGLAEAIKKLEELIKTNPKVRLWWREWVDNDFSNEDFIADPSSYKIDPSFGRE